MCDCACERIIPNGLIVYIINSSEWNSAYSSLKMHTMINHIHSAIGYHDGTSQINKMCTNQESEMQDNRNATDQILKDLCTIPKIPLSQQAQCMFIWLWGLLFWEAWTECARTVHLGWKKFRSSLGEMSSKVRTLIWLPSSTEPWPIKFL